MRIELECKVGHVDWKLIRFCKLPYAFKILTDKKYDRDLCDDRSVHMIRNSRRVLTPWLTARMSLPSSSTERLASAEKWKAAGKSTAITLIVNRVEFNCVAPAVVRQRMHSLSKLSLTEAKSLL